MTVRFLVLFALCTFYVLVLFPPLEFLEPFCDFKHSSKHYDARMESHSRHCVFKCRLQGADPTQKCRNDSEHYDHHFEVVTDVITPF